MKKVLLAWIICCFSLNTHSENQTNEREMIRLVTYRYNEILVNYAKQIEVCKSKRNSNKLSVNNVKHLSIPKDQLRITIGYLYFKNDYICMEEALTHYLIVGIALRQIDPSSIAKITISDELMLPDFKALYDLEVRYNQLSQHIKKQIELTPELNQPMDMQAVLDWLNEDEK